MSRRDRRGGNPRCVLRGAIQALWRRSFMLALAAATAASLFAAAPVEFWQITDTHLMKLDGVDPLIRKARQHYLGSTEALRRFLAGLPKPGSPAFVLHTGDIIDAFRMDGEGGTTIERQIEHAKGVLAGSPVPVYLTLGNHDIQHYRATGGKIAADRDPAIAAAARRGWRDAAACFHNGTYYSFRQKSGKTEYLFVVLDNGERAPPASSEHLRSQLQWLEKELAASRAAAIIVVMHIPLAKDPVSDAIADVLGKSSRIALILAGHRHTNGVEEIPIGGRIVPQIRTSAFAIDERDIRRVRLWEDRIEVFATGKPEQLERTIPVGGAAAAAAGAR